MKKLSLLFIMFVLLAACSRQDINEEPSDKWNGYFEMLKMGEQIQPLYAGKNINVGTVTCGIDNSCNFYVTYETTDGWLMSETHMFCGDKINLPVNKPGNPKVGNFPYSSTHSPAVNTVTYTVPLTTLPACDEPGFVVAAHCVVSRNGQTETGWRYGTKFTDKGWGWFDNYTWRVEENDAHTILYAIDISDGYLEVFHIDMSTTPVISTLTMKEYVGGTAGTFNGAAYDAGSSTLFFANVTTNELWVNQLDDYGASYLAGSLNGVATNGTFFGGFYYYVDANTNTIHKVGFNENWIITSEIVVSTLPNTTVTVNDIAMDATGSTLYVMAELSSGSSELIKYIVSDNSYYSIGLTINQDAEIAIGSNGQLYAVVPDGDGDGSVAYIIDTATGVHILIGGGGIDDEEDPGGGGKQDLTSGTIL
jgi:hypothetical protein